MSACTPCTRTINLPLCLDSIDIGVTTPSTAVFIYIMNNTTGRLIRLQDITSITGLITADVTNINFSNNHNYEVWVTLQFSNNIDERLTITGDGLSYTCASLVFNQLFDSTNVTTTYY